MREIISDIINSAVASALPYNNTRDIISREIPPSKKIYVIAVGKAAVPMMKAAEDELGDRIEKGLLVTKYAHLGSFTPRYCEVIEAAHPVCDDNSILAAEKGLDMVKALGADDILLVLLSGGGSALFEKSRVDSAVQREITGKLLSRAASIEEINAVRKRLSLVKGGRLAAAAYPAKVITIALSDVLSNNKSVIASGPTVSDNTDDEFLRQTVQKYLPDLSDEIKSVIFDKNEIKINDGGYFFAGDINMLCDAAGKRAEELGFTVHHCNRALTCEARRAAEMIIDSVSDEKGRHCYIYGSETVVNVTGNGKGGRNQEAALTAAIILKGRRGITFVSVSSDGTDGPTDAAGGFADGKAFEVMNKNGVDPMWELVNNNSYYALEKSGYLIKTGATGTNVNDLMMIFTYED